MAAGNSKSGPQKEFEMKYNHDGIPIDDPKLKGITRYLNSCTIRGRANVAKLTIGSFFLIYLYRKYK